MNNSGKKENNKKVGGKEWKQFKSKYTFLILGLLIYSLRPLRINSNSSELSYALEILNKSLSKENYKEELNLIIRFITSQFVKIGSNAREKIIEKSSTKSKMLDVLKLLLNVTSFTDFYTKLSKYEFGLTNNKDFFNFIASLINFSEHKKNKSLNIETRNKYIIFLIKRNANSPLNGALNKLVENNIVYDEKIKKYKNMLINVATEFFKNMAKNNNVQFVNSKIVLKSNINTIPTNKNITNKNNKIITNKNKNKTNISENLKKKNNSLPNSNTSVTASTQVLENVPTQISITSPTQVLENVPTKVLENVNQMKINGGNKNKSKSISKSMIKNMWWLKKY